MSMLLRAFALYNKVGDDGGNGSASGGEPAGGDPADGGSGNPPNPNDPKAPVDRLTLTQVLASQRKSLESDFDKRTQKLLAKLDALEKRLPQETEDAPPEATKPPGAKPTDPPKPDPEVARLRKQLDEQKAALDAHKAEIASEKQAARDATFRRQLIDALSEAGCLRPDLARRAIEADFKRELDGDKEVAYVEIEGQYGPERLTPAEYIKTKVRTEILPELFRSKVSDTGPAGKDGNSGGSGKKGRFTVEQLRDPVFYAANREAILAASKAGQIAAD